MCKQNIFITTLPSVRKKSWIILLLSWDYGMRNLYANVIY